MGVRKKQYYKSSRRNASRKAVADFKQSSRSNTSAGLNFIEANEYERINAEELTIEKTKFKINLHGSRIVNMGYILSWALRLQPDHKKICSAGTLQFKEEIRRGLGLVSLLIFQCDTCEKQVSYYTEDPNKKSIINYGAVWGTLSSGSTFSQLTNVLAKMDIPFMSQYKFQEIEQQLGMLWKDQLWEDMEAAGTEESRLAQEALDVDDDGVPFTTVYVDGGWSKRSYGHSYNASSGVAVIIGRHTKKLLFLGVRNKYCSICARAANKKIPPGQHTCYRNWSGSSSAMEADILMEGFRSSVMMHGLRFKNFIGDGDSSVFAKLREGVDYGRYINKQECTNHAIKNVGKALYNLKKDTKLNVRGRKMLTQEKISKIQKAAQSSIYRNAGGDVTILKQDLEQVIPNIFQKDLHLLKETDALDQLIKKGHKLIESENNNAAELYMSILAKFNCGKRLNLTQRGSFENRAYISGLQYNDGYKWELTAWKRFMECNPGQHFTEQIHNVIAKKDLSKAKKTLFINKKEKNTLLSNIDYGPKAIQPELSLEELESECERILARLQVSFEMAEEIASATVGQFGNPRYETERRDRLTASMFGAVVKRRKSTPCHNLVKEILYHSDVQSPAMEYGKANESLVRDLFAEKFPDLDVRPAGLYVDIEHGYLAASPDGLVDDEGILEIKCLYSVANSGKSLDVSILEDKNGRICLEFNSLGVRQLKRSHNYFYQIQGQLHTAQKRMCYFVVYRGHPEDLHIEVIQRDDTFWEKVMFPKLESFYLHCILPEIVRGNIPKGLKCKDPEQ